MKMGLFEWPERSHQRHLQVVGETDLGQKSRNEAKGREHISLEMIPALKHGVCPRSLWIHHRRKIHRKPMVEGGRKKVDGDRPSTEQIPANLLAEGPFGAQNLLAPRESATTLRWPRINWGSARTQYASHRRRMA